jgi:hypothetical protein
MQIKPFRQFFSEAIKLSQYRKVMKGVSSDYKEKYTEWFEGKWRIFLPLNNAPVDPIYHKINLKIGEKNWEIADWKGGLAKSKTSNKIMSIAKILNSLGDTELKLQFDNRFKGKVAADEDDYTVVISRHPYDIAGMSTDRAWQSCKHLEDGCNKHYIPTEIEAGALIAYVIKTSDIKNVRYKSTNVFTIWTMMTSNNTKYHEMVDKLVEKGFSVDEDELSEIEFYSKVYIEVETTTKMAKVLAEPNGSLIGSDEFFKKVDSLVKVKEVGQRKLDILANPISRLLIIPVVDNDDETALYVGDKFYGKSVKGFKEIVEDWVYEQQGFVTDPSRYHIDQGTVYDDDYEEFGPDGRLFPETFHMLENEDFQMYDENNYLSGSTRNLEILNYILAASKQRSRYFHCVSVYFNEEKYAEIDGGNYESWEYSQVKDEWEAHIDDDIKEELYEKYIPEEKRVEGSEDYVSLEEFVENTEEYISGFQDHLLKMYDREYLMDRARGMQEAIKDVLTDHSNVFNLRKDGDGEWVLRVEIGTDDIEAIHYALDNSDWRDWRDSFCDGKTIDDIWEDGDNHTEGVSTSDIEEYIRDQFL